MKLKILTFNWHEPYICNLSKLGYQFYVASPEIAPNNFRDWDRNMRDVPKNCELISLAEAHQGVYNNQYDLLIAHNIKDLIAFQSASLPKICVFHCRLSTEIALSKNPIDRNDYLEKLAPFLQDVSNVFISESKLKDWGLKGHVIHHGIDINEFEGYTGENSCVLRVGNLLKEMDLARGYTLSEEILEGFPSVTLGLNPTIGTSQISQGFEDLLNHYRKCRVYLSTSPDQYEDGYNLSLLEAMATGMPVISIANSTSPIVNGENGFISDDIERLRGHLRELLECPDLAKEMGKKARATVQEKFGLDKFLNKWKQLIESTLVNYLNDLGIQTGQKQIPFKDKKKKNILLDYVSHPATTAYYMHRALEKSHNIVTCGAVITHEVIRQWDLKELNWPIEPQDIFRPSNGNLQDVVNQLVENWNPDFYLFIETGLSDIPPDLHKFDFPKVCYLIDTHIHLEKHIEIAKNFDYIFLAQKEYIPEFKKNGMTHVEWLPLACDPEIHGKQNVEKKYEVGFVGSITDNHARRKQLLKNIGEHFDLHIDRKFMDEMTRVFCQSKIVFNNSINHDLNMRVFEGLCSGSLLITDPAANSGLEELFENGRHLIIYQDEKLIETIEYYLNHPDKIKEISECGRQEVLNKHTYGHRVQSIIDYLNKNISPNKNELPLRQASKEYYHHVREDILPLIPDSVKTVLEIGCGAGKTGEYLKNNKNCFVAGVEINSEAVQEASQVLDEVIEGNIEDIELPFIEKSFDCILFADVLEHLVNPLATLKKSLQFLKSNGSIIASIPNVQYFGLVHHLIEGNWTYQDEGILDRTHLRFFTLKEIKKLFKDAGLEIKAIDETLAPQYEDFAEKKVASIKIGRMTISDLSPEELKQFFVFQYKVLAQPILNEKIISKKDSKKYTSHNWKNEIQKAKELESEENYEEALKIFKAVSQENPNCLESWLGQGKGFFRFQNWSEAEECYEKALKIDLNCNGAMVGLGSCYFQKNDFEKAEEYYQNALQINPSDDKALCGLGMIQFQKGNVGSAKEEFIRSLESNIENSPALTCLLQVAYKLDEFEEIKDFLQRYLELHPANLNMLFGLAGVQFKQGRLEDVRETLNRILIFDPKHKDSLDLLKVVEEQVVTP